MTTLTSHIGNTDAYPVLNHWNFFNHAGVAPLPKIAADAMRKFTAEAEAGAYLQTSWYTDIEKLRVSAASLINAEPTEIAFVKNTSEGISIVANGVDWHPRNRIITTAVEYPANIYPWMEVARTRGAELILVNEETDEHGRRYVPIEKILEAAHHPRTRLITLSHVEFASGQRHDLARIGAFCRERNILFCIDAIQTLGVLPIDVKTMNIDYLSADGHKWLLGPEGAGIFYCRHELLEKTRPVIVGWMNVINAQDYGNYDFTLRPDAARYECGSHNIAGFLGLKASLEMLHSLGTDSISNRLKTLTQHLINGLETKNYQILSPRTANQWSGIVSFTSPRHKHDEIVRTLRKNHKTEIALREGRLRCSPHFYNTEKQIDQLIEALPRH